ncbi:helix-turn-helix domain-containing protein [Mucilaginibacter sp. SJ]|uniref:helix-turn-helix domain-containing protein n=1 Tax=Mucilaginibacter sp. SJ TaxID=3029053 RepID=UPI0023AA09B4|nr:helix-turn-helix domain-containing protein [Mucilaginibacter sp. SJ]WEA01676.1 helix-turn-helix domain-containing protein [Mucilaginibacter sp. SJ]
MNVELVTREDLRRLEDLLKEIKQIVQPGQSQPKKWLKSSEVRKMLNISPGTLQNLRINGTLRFTKMGSIMFYKLEDINKILEENGQ